MHALNPTAALVWEQCDGKTDPTQMAARLESVLNVSNADKLVALSLDRLQKAHLLEGVAPQTQRTITRREVLKMAGIGLALLPVVSSIALPSPAEAQSCEVNCFFITVQFLADCTASCENDLIAGEILCSAEDIGNGLCQCNTQLPAGADPNVLCDINTTGLGHRRAR